MFNWKIKGEIKAQNAIILEEGGQEGRPFKCRFLQAGLVKYDFGVCLLQKETIDKFINTFVECPVIINHSDNINSEDIKGTIQKIWFSPDDGWFWCSGIITDEEAAKLIEQGYNVSCQYAITEWKENVDKALHNGNQYDKEILNGIFEHLAIVENPRYEGAFIAVNGQENCRNEYQASNPLGAKAYIASNAICKNDITDANGMKHDNLGRFTGDKTSSYNQELKDFIQKAKANPNERTKINVGEVSAKLQQDAKAHGVDLTGYTHDLDVSGTRHAYKNHGNEKTEASRGQIAITDEDFEKIPDIVDDYDDIEFEEEDKKGTPLIKYRKNFDDNSTYYVEEIRTKHNKLTIKTMYKTKKASNSGIFVDELQRSEYTSTIIIAYNESDFNPIVTINKETNYDKVFDYIRNTKGESMDNETKGLFRQLAQALVARNEAEKEKEDDKASNEDVDKRKLIDEVGGILKDKVDEEVWRTIIGKIEKVAYDKSEAGTADNKAKNEEDEDDKEKAENKKVCNEDVDKRDLIRQIMAIAGKHEDNEDVRTIAKLAEKLAYDKSEAGTADNSKAKNKCRNEEDEKLYDELKEKVDKAAENKAKNSLDDVVNKLYATAIADTKPAYISPKKGIELGEQIYGAK